MLGDIDMFFVQETDDINNIRPLIYLVTDKMAYSKDDK